MKKLAKDKNHSQVRDHWKYTGKYRGTAHIICKLRFNVLREITVVFHNVSSCGYHFIIKELAKKFEGQFDYFGENTEKHKTFTVPTQKRSHNSKTY